MKPVKLVAFFVGCIFLNLFLVSALGLTDGHRFCGRGSCASGTAVVASIFLMVEAMVVLAAKDVLDRFLNGKKERVRATVPKSLASDAELTSKQLAAMTSEERFQHFLKQVEGDRKSNVKTG